MTGDRDHASDDFDAGHEGGLDDDRGFDPVQGERRLWRMVILQALQDATTHVNKRSARLQQRNAIYWLTMNREDFATVCDLAEMSPTHVRRLAREFIRQDQMMREGAKGLSKIEIARLAMERMARCGWKGGDLPPPAIYQPPRSFMPLSLPLFAWGQGAPMPPPKTRMAIKPPTPSFKPKGAPHEPATKHLPLFAGIQGEGNQPDGSGILH